MIGDIIRWKEMNNGNKNLTVKSPDILAKQPCAVEEISF